MDIDVPSLEQVKEHQLYLLQLRQEQRIKEIMQNQKERNDKTLKNVVSPLNTFHSHSL